MDSATKQEFSKIWRALKCKANCGDNGKGWSLDGNSNTNSALNFIGTTDAQSLVFKVDNVFSGFLDNDNTNTSFGIGALSAITSGEENVAIGSEALKDNTDGSNNIAVGVESLSNNTTGIRNTAIGSGAGSTNITGIENTFIGREAGGATNSTNNSIALGHAAVASSYEFAIPSDITNVKFGTLPEFADNISAINGGLVKGSLYMTTTGGNSFIKIVV